MEGKSRIDVDGLMKRIEDKRKNENETTQNCFVSMVNELREKIDFVNENLLGQANDLIKIHLSLSKNHFDYGISKFLCNEPSKIGFVVCKEKDSIIAISVYMTDHCKCNDQTIIGATNRKLIFKTTDEGMMPEQCDESHDALEWLESVKDFKLSYAKFKRTHGLIGIYLSCLTTLIDGFGKFRDDFLAYVEERLK